MPANARSLLFVPADQPRRLERAWTESADAVIADLEDAVAPDAKQAARETLEQRLAAGPPKGALCVRVNALDSPYAADDLALVARWPSIDAVVVPKANAAALREAQLDRPTIALVETATGILEASEIATCPGVVRMMLGTVDLAAELGVEIAIDTPIFECARAALALASAASGLPGPIDGVWTGVDDEAGLRAEARAARAIGFTGKACIHPRQLAAVTEELAPTADELDSARRIVAAGDEALAAGEGAIVVDGRMVDLPVLERARRLLEQAGETTT